MSQLLRVLGLILLAGGLAHTAGVVHLYVTNGVPDANRVLLDVWIAQAQLIGGGLYLAAFHSRRAGRPSRAFALFGALTIIGFSAPMLPVLFSRAPLVFLIPQAIYLCLSVFIGAVSTRPEP